MPDLLCRCACGYTKKVSEYAVGMTTECPKCSAEFMITVANTRPLEPPKPPEPKIIAAISTADQKPVVGPQQCARCKRPFRGDWDRYYSPAGTVCHVCANLAERIDPKDSSPRLEPVKMPDIPPPVYIPHEPAAQPKVGKGSLAEQFEDFKETTTFRLIIWGAAALVMGGALFAHFYDGGFNPPRMEQGQYGNETPESGSRHFASAKTVTEGQGAAIVILVRLLMLFFLIVPNFAALYWVLAQAERLPCYHWWSNIIHVGVAAAIMAVPIWAADLLTSSLPLAGGLLGMALYAVMYYIVYEVYDLFVRDIIKLIVARFLLFFLMVLVQTFVYGGIGLLLSRS